MSQLTKQQLKGENQTQFPNNNVGAITPSNLRAFNVDMIDSTVNQTDFTNFSGSVGGEIDTLQAEVLQLQNFSASLSGGFVTEGELAAATASLIASINTKLDTTTFNAYTQSNDLALDVLESSASLALTTASFGAGTLTFTKGDGTTFGVVIPDVSGSTIDTGSLVTTASFNAYTQSNDAIVNALVSATSSYVTETESGSFLITASFGAGTLTFTKGDNTTFALTIPDISGSAFAFPSIETISGSLLITANGFTSGAASIDHISESTVNSANLIIKTSNTTQSTIISGSGNIISNPISLGADRVAYMNSNNITLGVGVVSSLTGSAASIAGNRPTISNNILTSLTAGAATFIINQSPNGGTHAYSGNILAGSGVFLVNALGSTGTISVGSNIGPLTATINAASRSIAEINAGATGSNNIGFTSNLGVGSINYNGPVSQSSAQGHNIFSNFIGSILNLNLQSGSRTYNIGNNHIANTITVNDNTQFSPTLGSTNSIANNIIGAAITINQRASASIAMNSNIGGGFTINNDYDASTNTVAAQRQIVFNNNNINAANAVINYSGSAAANRGFVRSLMIGNNITASLVGNTRDNSLADTSMLGSFLFISGTHDLTIPSASAGTLVTGRHNDLNRARSAEHVLIVGTGTSTARKTGFLIDSGSNTFIEGTLNVSGATSLNGNLIVTGSLTASLATGFTYVGDGTGRTIAVATSSISPFPFIGNAQITGGLAVSGGNEIRFRTNGVAGIIPIFDIGVTTNPGGADSIFASAEDFNFNFVGDFKLNGDNLSITGPDVQINLYDTTAPAANSFQLQNSNSTFRITAQNGGTFPIATFSTSSIELLDPTRISGSLTLSGSLYIQSGSTLPVSTGSAILTWDAATGQVKQASFNTIVSASVSSAEFWSTTTQSGSAGVSGSIQFNNSGSFYNISLVNGTQLTVGNAGVYNIQFSAQVETSAGADTVYIWFKKNGTNIGDSASKAVLANNTAQIMTVNILDEAQANDYYEIAYQTLNGNATVLAEAASGNIPAIPSVIATVFQIR